MVVLALSAAMPTQARWGWLAYARAASTTYLLIVVAVYWTLLVDVDVQTPLEWTNLIMHAFSAAFMLLDWMIEGPRKPLSWRMSWTVLIYPVIWLTVVIARGATDGWVPYPFLDPWLGYPTIALICGGIALGGWLLGLVVFQLTRWRVIAPPQGELA